MELRILGARAYIKSEAEGYRLHAGLLIDGKLLLDVGEAGFMKYAPRAIFITHLHPDHAFFVLGGDVLATDMYGPEERLGVKRLDGPVTVEGYRVTPVPTLHSALVRSQGYLVEKAGKRIFYTGDIAWIEKSQLTKLPKLDALVAEASYIRRGGLVRKHAATGRIYGHTGVPDIVRMFRDKTHTIVFMHMGSWFVKDPVSGKRLLKAFERKDLKIVVARDGMTLKV